MPALERTYQIEGGLIVGPNEGECAGYIFNFEGHGAYDPTGLVTVGNLQLTQEQVNAHNALLGKAEMEQAVKDGKGLFYFSYDTLPGYTAREGRYGRGYTNYRVSNWCGSFKSPHVYATKSFTPGFNCSERWHVYFTGPDGKRWYGVNQGNSQIVRGRRLKRQGK